MRGVGCGKSRVEKWEKLSQIFTDINESENNVTRWDALFAARNSRAIFVFTFYFIFIHSQSVGRRSQRLHFIYSRFYTLEKSSQVYFLNFISADDIFISLSFSNPKKTQKTSSDRRRSLNSTEYPFIYKFFIYDSTR